MGDCRTLRNGSRFACAPAGSEKALRRERWRQHRCVPGDCDSRDVRAAQDCSSTSTAPWRVCAVSFERLGVLTGRRASAGTGSPDRRALSMFLDPKRAQELFSEDLTADADAAGGGKGAADAQTAAQAATAGAQSAAAKAAVQAEASRLFELGCRGKDVLKIVKDQHAKSARTPLNF